MSILKQCKASLQYFLLAVCAALLLKQKLGILKPQGLQWEGKASGTIPVVGACCEIQRSVNPEPPEGLRFGPVCCNGPGAWRRKRRWCGGRRGWKESDRGRDETKIQRLRREKDSQGLLGGKKNTITHGHEKLASASLYSWSRVTRPAEHTGGCHFLHAAYTLLHISPWQCFWTEVCVCVCALVAILREQNKLSGSAANIIQVIKTRQEPTGGHLLYFTGVI